MRNRSTHELAKERGGLGGTTLELGMGLARDKPWMLTFGKLDHLDKTVVRREATDDESCAPLGQLLAEGVVDLIAMAMALVDELLAIGLAGERAHDLARVGTQAHSASLVGDVLLVGHEVDDRIGALGVKLGGVGTREATGMARKLRDGNLESQAHAQKGDLSGARSLSREDLALDAALAEASGHKDAIGTCENLIDGGRVELLSIDELDGDVAPIVDAGVVQRLDDGEVGVGQLDVLTADRLPRPDPANACASP